MIGNNNQSHRMQNVLEDIDATLLFDILNLKTLMLGFK